jgi:hypothetical protein
MPDPIGVPVWRWWQMTTLVTGKIIRDNYYRDDEYPGPRESHYPSEPGLWFPTSPEAVAEMQQAIARRIGFDLECSVVDGDECAWNLMAILGFTDA